MRKCTKCELQQEDQEFRTVWRGQRGKYYTVIYCNSCCAKIDKEYREKNFEILNEKRRLRKGQKKKRVGVDPIKYKCRYVLKNEVDRGKFPKSEICEHCKKKPEKSSEIHAHHIDYSQPFLVVWLCKACHIQEHRRLKKYGDMEPQANDC